MNAANTFEALETAPKEALLAEGLVAVITGGDFDSKYFDRLPEIWDGNPEFEIAVSGFRTAIGRDSIRFDIGNAQGNLSGITPVIEVLDDTTDTIRRTKLSVDGFGNPNFLIRQVV